MGTDQGLRNAPSPFALIILFYNISTNVNKALVNALTLQYKNSDLLDELSVNNKDLVNELVIENVKTGEVQSLQVEGAFIALGSNPESSLAVSIGVETRSLRHSCGGQKRVDPLR